MWLYLTIFGLLTLGGWALMRAQYRQGLADANKATAERTTDALVEEIKRQNTHLTTDDVANGLLLWAEQLRKK